MKHLFLAGCERSGTTALLRFLNEDPRIVLGRERFKFVRKELAPEMFEPASFFDPKPEETNYRNEDYYGKLRQRYETGEVRYIGDKVPLYYRNLPLLRERFPDSRIVFIVRDPAYVAASYNARAANPEDVNWPPRRDYREAMENWKTSASRLRAFFRDVEPERLFVVPYENFFYGGEDWMEALYAFLGLDVTAETRSAFEALTRGWEARMDKPPALSTHEARFVDEHRSFPLEIFARFAGWRCREQWPPKGRQFECPLCGGAAAKPGPSGRLTLGSASPRCRGCGSLERDRALYRLLQRLDDYSLVFRVDDANPVAEVLPDRPAPAGQRTSVAVYHFCLQRPSGEVFDRLCKGELDDDVAIVTLPIDIGRRRSLIDSEPRRFGLDVSDLFAFPHKLLCFELDPATSAPLPVLVLSHHPLDRMRDALGSLRCLSVARPPAS